MQSKNQYFKALVEKFLYPILTNFPSFKLNALLRPGRLFQKLSCGLGFIENNNYLTLFFLSKNRKITDIRPASPYTNKSFFS